ncbi:PREDICTED: uncharacterized protein LOC107064458 [Polistes dominula]|uniref:Gustatory receptor n=1 Tax=Polistes dominula TaxID=743375 RepID=A0ABM1HXF1_POLDO|nr:PREDICTED: uncharacterized protein LOC107064458 [Polistes dominula]
MTAIHSYQKREFNPNPLDLGHVSLSSAFQIRFVRENIVESGRMVGLTQDIKPFLQASRIFGCGPHVITDEDILVTKRGMIYTFLWMSIYLSTCIIGIYLIIIDTEVEYKSFLLTLARTSLSYICLFTDAVLSIVWNGKIRAAFVQLRNFDRTIRFNERSTKSNNARRKCQALVLITFLVWFAVGYTMFYVCGCTCMYVHSCEESAPMFNGITYGMVNAAISMQLLKFVGLSFVLYQRFRRLCEILLLPEDGKIMVVDQARMNFRLEEIWWLHCCLSNATQIVNSVYAASLFFWIISMSFNTLSRLYTINGHDELPTLLLVRESLLISACIGNLFLIIAICHVTASQANDVGKIAFSPLSSVIGKRNFTQDNIEVAAYFQLRKVYFFAGGGMIRIDLSLLLTIASGIMTYLVILHANNV